MMKKKSVRRTPYSFGEAGMPNLPAGRQGAEVPKEVKAERLKAKALPVSPKELNSAIDTPHSEPQCPLEHLEKTNKSEKLKQQPTANSKLQTENMEVHHHPEMEKKGFKEYILEGLMIFLAVMMGFIAENVREGISERKRAAEFARSYFEDVKKDTAALNADMRFSKHKVAVIDSAVTMLHYPAEKQNDTVLYKQLSVSSNVMAFEPSSGTYEQIKSSGSLRYFDQKLVSLMNSYDVQAKKTLKREDIDLRFILEQLLPFAIQTSNTEVIYDIYFKRHISHELYIDKSNDYIRLMINKVIIVKIERLRAMTEYVEQMKIANSVLAELHKEYYLE